MSRIVTAILSFHWAIVFTLVAVGRLGGYGHLATWPGSDAPLADSLVALATAGGYGLVAILFLWTTLSALAGRHEADETTQVARLAFCGAVLALTAALMGEGPSTSADRMAPFAVQLAALLCTYLVIRADVREAAGEKRHEGLHIRRSAAARRMALGAAHRTMLAPPGRFVAANDEKER